MATNNDVTVIIDIQKPTPRLGFGKPLILGASTAGKPYKNYADIDAVKSDYAASTEEYKAALAIFSQGDNAPAEIAIYSRKTGATPEVLSDALAALMLLDWYFLISTSAASADVLVIGDAVELNGTRQFFSRSDSKTDLAIYKAKKWTRTTVGYHPTITNYPEAAWIGETGSAPVGSVTWKFKTLTGISPVNLNATELNEIHGLAANTYVTKAGDDVTSEGKVVSGEYIDIIHAKDYVISTIQFAVQKLLNKSPKISYDYNGIAQLESVVKTELQRAFNQGIIAADADGIGLYSTNFKSRSDVDAADRAARTYNDGSFIFELAGAIHQTTIRGTIKL
ncbi:DUF3383 family protein [Paenibacillus alba]|uniref:DUF3383 family protein n=1 Tax=Paenibacillus alba TaxID=1197127 RepID=UPI001566357F|nr:DUF3383 family protein [Paenibacillus alba]NQX68485.1 DUF3383 family protein [Paenibacillus alba]